MRKSTKFLCCLTTFATLVVCLDTAGLDDTAQVEYDEHLFVAGNDSTGTASITYASRANPHPISIRFENFSYPDSCAFHPSRCRNLTYLMSTTDDNHTRLIFYVPLTKSALGVVEFFYNGTALSHKQTRTVDFPRQCNPISVINFFGALHLLCLVNSGRGDFIMQCEVRNAMSVTDIQLSCLSPHHIGPFELSHLSNFFVYGNRAIDAYIYFTYKNAMYAKVPSGGGVNFIAYLSPGYSYCRHLDFVNSSIPQELIACYCYNTNTNQIQVVYFDLNTDSFLEQRNASQVVRYHCPSQQTFVGVATVGAFASFWQGESYRGSFHIIGNSVSFGRCFELGGSLHFLYHDEQLGTFIKPNISTNLLITVKQLSLQGCVNPACEQPMIFKNRYNILVQLKTSSLRDWTLRLVDMERGWNQSILSFKSSSTSQLALISDLMRVPIDPSIATTPGVEEPKSNSAAVISTSATVPTLLVITMVATPLLVYYVYLKQRQHKHKRGVYAAVQPIRNENNSRQQSPTEGDMEMEDLSNEHNHDHEQLSTSSASSTLELEREDTNPGTQDSNVTTEPPTGALDRDNYGVLGSSRSMEDVQNSGNSVVTTLQPPPPPASSGQPRPPPAPSGQTFTATQGNATVQQQSPDSAKMLSQGVSSSSAPPAGNNTNTIPLHSQRSDDSTANSTNSGSIYVPASSQTTRPQSLLNFTPSQHSQLQASPGSIPPPPPNYSAVHCSLRTNSTESNTSHTSCNLDGRVSNETTPFSGTPSSPMVDLMYTASQTSLQHDSELPLDRNAYTAVGCSQEDIQRPRQCTQQPAVGQMSGNTNSNASAVRYTSTSSSTASTPHQQYGGAMGYTGGTNNTTQQQYPGNLLSLGASPRVTRYNSQHSNESTGSGTSPSSIPDNSISAHTFHSQPTRRQSLTYYNISAPFVHNQTIDPNYYNTAGQLPGLNRMDSNTSQHSGAGIRTPTDSSTPSFFPSTNQGSTCICPPSHVPLSAPQNATNT